MFGTQFYPTPSTLLYKMTDGMESVDFYKRFLDPSAGKGL